MSRKCPAEVRHQVIQLARSGTKVAQLATTFGMSDATIYKWLKQERIDLAAPKRKIKQLETELAASRKVNEVFLDQDLHNTTQQAA